MKLKPSAPPLEEEPMLVAALTTNYATPLTTDNSANIIYQQNIRPNAVSSQLMTDSITTAENASLTHSRPASTDVTETTNISIIQA